MSINLDHAFERLTHALKPMATEPGTFHGRLERAYHGFLGLMPDELPNDLQRTYEDIKARLTCSDIALLPDPEAESIAKELFDLYVQVNQRRAGIA
jgi:hypothetical protein